MYRQHSELKGDKLIPVEDGPTVTLTAQTQDHRAIFQNAAGEEFNLPASEFFQTHREATADEIEAANEAAADARKPLRVSSKS